MCTEKVSTKERIKVLRDRWSELGRERSNIDDEIRKIQNECEHENATGSNFQYTSHGDDAHGDSRMTLDCTRHCPDCGIIYEDIATIEEEDAYDEREKKR